MSAATARKSGRMNRLEGYLLIALFQGLPTFAAAALMLKLVGDRGIAGEKGGAAIFVALATPVYALLLPALARKFPKAFKNGPDPVLFDASLSFSGKVAKWRSQPTASLQLLSAVITLSLLAVGAASMG